MNDRESTGPIKDRDRLLPVRERLEVELNRLEHGVADDEMLIGVTAAEFRIACNGDAREVLARAREVMVLAVKTGIEERWPITETLEARLPDWFVKACRPEQSLEEMNAEYEYRKTLSREEREAFDATNDKRWEAGAWAAGMNPDYAPDLKPHEKDPFDERQWHWWDAELVNDDTIVAVIDQMDWEVLSDSFRWLFIAAGAVEIDGETHH